MVQSKYSIWARHFRYPVVKEGEDPFDAVYRIALSFLGKTMLRAHIANVGGAKVFRDQAVLIRSVYKIDMRGAEVKKGSTITSYPKVEFVGECTADDGRQWVVEFDANELYENKKLLAKDSARMCGDYAETLSRLVGTAKWEAKHLSSTLRDYRDVATEFIGRGYAGKRIWKNPKLDELINKLMPLADDPLIAEVCDD